VPPFSHHQEQQMRAWLQLFFVMAITAVVFSGILHAEKMLVYPMGRSQGGGGGTQNALIIGIP
jgi:hypothetical protein